MMTVFLTFAISAVILICRYFVLNRKLLQPYMVKPEDIDQSDHSPSLYLINGCGTRFVGHFRDIESIYVTYQFLCFFYVPIIPIGSYWVRKHSDNGYQVFGGAKWKFLEIIAIYFQWYGWIVGLVSSLVIFGELLHK